MTGGSERAGDRSVRADELAAARSQVDDRRLADIATELVDTRRRTGGHGSGSSG